MRLNKRMKMTIQNCLTLLLIVASSLADTPATVYLRQETIESSQQRKRGFNRHLQSKADRLSHAFVQQLNAGVAHTTHVEQEFDDQKSGTCNVSGSVTYSIRKVSELNTRQGATTLQPLQDESNQVSNMWLLNATFDSFTAYMTAQVLGKHCGRVVDVTSFGQVTVDGATIMTTLQLLGPYHRPQVVTIVDEGQHHIGFEKNSTFSKLIRMIPLERVERDIGDFIHSLFTTTFRTLVEGELTKST
jgi:hypothetical protein